MRRKERWTCIVFLFVLCPVMAYSQTDLYGLSGGEMAVGLSFGRSQNSSGMGGSVGYGISDRTKVALTAGVSFANEDLYDSSSVHLPPALGSGVMLIHIMPLGRTGLDYFLSGGVHTTFSRTLDASTDKLLASARSVGLSGGGGLLKRLEMDFGLTLNPFCSIVFSEAGANLDTKDGRVEVRGNPTFFTFAGGVGLEIELSPMISIVGGFQISLKDFYRGFSIGLNFH